MLPDPDQTAPANAIAIVGMACRFPGAADPDRFWDNLIQGVESIRRFSREELLAGGIAPALVDNPRFVSAHGALDDIAGFDAEFFSYTPAEAALIDPQHRLLLECAWSALENAGIDPSRSDPATGLTGIFAGCGLPGYLLSQVHPALDADDPGASYQAILGNDKDFLASRVAYKLDLGGPAMTVQAACATSLVCVHSACQSLLNGECDAALAGGVSLRIPQASGYLYQAGGIHSADGHCRAFDAEADGTVGGSGVGMVVLKRLADARAAGDTIHAVIRGSAVNNDGARKLSFTAPGVDGQTAVIAEAQAVAGVAPDSIAYVEAHGTGTALGDPIEIAALSQAFGPAGDGRRCLIGSVKTNIGHLDAAAGIAGLIKTVLALRHGVIPPSLHFRCGNPNIDFAGGRFRVCAEATPWPESGTPRRAGVSAFGLGGCNAHVVLEQAPAESRRPEPPGWRLHPLSARSADALRQTATRLARHLETHPEIAADGLAWTLAQGRQAFSHAGFAVAAGPAELARALSEGRWERGRRPAAAPRIAFLYPGQGAQQAGAGRLLYADEPVFRDALDACAQSLLAAGAADVRLFLLQPPSPALEDALRLTANAQPVLFALGYALTALWRHRGIVPEAVLGHSSGEYAAAAAAGVLSLADAARALAARARLMAEMPPGAMSAVGMAESELLAALPAGLSVAAVNGPALCTVAGDPDTLAVFEAGLAPRGVLVRRLRTAHAFHTAAVDPLLERFRAELDGIALHQAETAFYSAVLGRRATAQEAAQRDLWVGQIRRPVRFAPALDALLADGFGCLVEIGPGHTLSTLARLSPASETTLVVPGPGKDGDERRDLLHGLGRLWLAGANPHWPALFEAGCGVEGGAIRPGRISLPTYPFEPVRHWLESRRSPTAHGPTAALQTNHGNDLPLRAPLHLLVPSWRRAPPLPRVTGGALAANWLIFGGDGGLSLHLAELLRQAGGTVEIAGCFAPARQDGEWRDEDCAALLRRCRPERVVFASGPSAARARDLSESLGALFRLVRALARTGPPLREICVLGSGALDVTGTETLDPAQAMLFGAARVIPSEFPETACRLLDTEPGSAPAWLADAVAAELAQPVGGAAIALRGPHRWTFAMIPALPPEASVSPIRRDGVYLVTGGLGGLGLSIASRIAAEAPVRLALLGRSAFPPAAEWESWLENHAEDDETSRTIVRLRAIEALGATLRVFRADCADAADMQAAVDEIRAQWGDPSGVVHAAGVPGGGAMALRSAAQIAAVLRPKTLGTQLLMHALAGVKLDFAVFFSSVNTLLAVPGQADYAAANAFLEAEAARLRRQGIRATAVAWDAWRDAGMAADAELPESLRARRREELAAFGLATDQACDVFIRILSGEFTHVAVVTGGRLAAIGLPPSTAAPEPASAELPPEAKPGNVIDGLAEIWISLLGLSSVTPEDDFFRLGGHSLLATRVGFRVRRHWGCDIAIEEVFAHPTLAAMAALIESRCAGGDEREMLLL